MTDKMNVPENLPDFTADDVKNDARYPELRTDAAMRFIVKEIEREVSEKTGSYGMILGVRPLNGQNKPTYPGTRLRLTAPWKNPGAPGLKYEKAAPNTLNQWHKVLNALYPDQFPSFPKKVGNVWVTDGGAGQETLSTKEDNDARREKICAAIRERIQHYWKNPKDFLDEVFIAQPVEDTGKEGTGSYIQLDAFKVWHLDTQPSVIGVPVLTEKFTV